MSCSDSSVDGESGFNSCVQLVEQQHPGKHSRHADWHKHLMQVLQTHTRAVTSNNITDTDASKTDTDKTSISSSSSCDKVPSKKTVDNEPLALQVKHARLTSPTCQSDSMSHASTVSAGNSPNSSQTSPNGFTWSSQPNADASTSVIRVPAKRNYLGLLTAAAHISNIAPMMENSNDDAQPIDLSQPQQTPSSSSSSHANKQVHVLPASQQLQAQQQRLIELVMRMQADPLLQAALTDVYWRPWH